MRNKPATPELKRRDLVLVGGGHAHALAIKMLAMKPIDDVRVTLVSEHTETPYSGMLPGFVAGHYQHSETVIDLNKLCQAAGVRWLRARVNGVDLEANELRLEAQPDLPFDCLSLNTGSNPGLPITGEGAAAIGVKPIANFHQQWRALREQLSSLSGDDLPEVAIVGGGVGGVELCLAMAAQFSSWCKGRMHLVYSSDQLLTELPRRAARIAEQELLAAGVVLHPGFHVEKAGAETLTSSTGEQLKISHSFFCTHASAPAWPESSGLAVSEKGFIAVNNFLQSDSHSNVFAVGDVAHMSQSPRPKAGVYAVRQAPQLVENWHRFFASDSLKTAVLQDDFLRLISLGGKRAIACRNGFALAGAWAWQWKNRIDQRFMQQFQELSESAHMAAAGDAPNPQSAENNMHCAGCGSKLGPQLLQKNLTSLSDTEYDNPASTVNAALQHAEDATSWQLDEHTTVVQSIDGFRSFTDDLYQFGRITVNHALNDIYAMGSKPSHALAWATVEYNHTELQQRDHLRLMQGVQDELKANDAELAGGHSSEGLETQLAIVANARADKNNLWRKNTVRPNQVLCLSKALGTGVILAANAEMQAPAEAVDAAMQSMLESNRATFEYLLTLAPSAVTDVSGFGVLGHLLEMLAGSDCNAVLDVGALPALPGALNLLAAGKHSSLQPSLSPALQGCALENGLQLSDPRVQLLLDPQTSGGLLVALEESEAVSFCQKFAQSKRIGKILGRGEEAQRVHLHQNASCET